MFIKIVSRPDDFRVHNNRYLFFVHPYLQQGSVARLVYCNITQVRQIKPDLVEFWAHCRLINQSTNQSEFISDTWSIVTQ